MGQQAACAKFEELSFVMFVLFYGYIYLHSFCFAKKECTIEGLKQVQTLDEDCLNN
jgi:hypothetical protein